jgi:hypothetical protein
MKYLVYKLYVIVGYDTRVAGVFYVLWYDSTKLDSIKKGSATMPTPFKYGAPGAIRTPDPLVRSQVLYPTELRALK